MGFQGDVAGIGLGELLQGLVRGGSEGLLTLHGGGLVGSIGVRDGQLHLLPEPDEDPEIWRKRSERAWARSPDFRIDTMRMEEIAYAARIEAMFQLLDSHGVHFRFEPGPLPTPGLAAPTETPQFKPEDTAFREAPRLGPSAPGAVHCAPISVEFMLLEYARLSDECQGYGDYEQVSRHDVPRVLDAGSPPADKQRFWQECDGMSNVVEISDRLGWPLRRCQAAVLELITKGLVRIASAREMLVLAQREIGDMHFARAASRLSAWVRHARPGPPPEGDVGLLVAEWEHGRLPVVLASMEAPFARTLLRRIDLVEQDWKKSIERWTELRKHHRHDTISEVRLIGSRLKSGAETDAPAINNLLRLARSLQELGHAQRAGVLLRVAARGLPETTSMRLELGTRMLAVGLVEEGVPWIIEAARTLINSGLAEKAIGPLRALIDAQSNNRDARQLLNLARARSAQGRRRRRNVLIGMSLLIMLSFGAVVQMHLERSYNDKLGEVTNEIDRPQIALAMLEERFPNDLTPRVVALRQSLVKSLQAAEDSLREAWLDRYRACQLECSLGDPMLGLRKVLELPIPPDLQYSQDEWPTKGDLLEGLAAQLEQTIAEWAPPVEAVADAELRFASLLDEMRGVLAERDDGAHLAEFEKRLSSIDAALAARRLERERLIAARERSELLNTQDGLLQRARSYYKAGDLERSVATYDELFALPDGGKLARVLTEEVAAARTQAAAVRSAIALAEQGRHAEAVTELERHLPDPSAFLLPWKVATIPAQSLVRFSDGTQREAPVHLVSAIGETVSMTLELAGHDPLELSVSSPADQLVRLSRTPNIHWSLANRVEAPPVAFRDLYILCDRSGLMTCVSSDGSEVWSHSLDTLGGIARAPVFLPRKPGWLLCLTEDGEAYLVDAQGGQLQGPEPLGAPPIWGPTATDRAVLAKFRSGLAAEWDRRLVPVKSESSAPVDDALRFGSDCGMRLLRNKGAGELSLDSHGFVWSVSVEDTAYVVTNAETGLEAFAVRRSGDWIYLAWEAPRAELLGGRLWISDAAGLRGFEP